MYNGGKPHLQGTVIPHNGGYEPTRLSGVVNAWLQKEVSHSMLEEIRRRDGMVHDSVAGVAKGPFYASLFLRHKTLSTPPVVQQLKAQTKVSWEIKVFTKILRAAAIVDEKCFLWNYETGRDPMMYEASAVITCIDIIRPKPGIFESHVHYILVICTFSTVELVAVHAKDPHRNEIKLQKLPEYQLTTGNTVMQCIATYEAPNTEHNTRIFIGGNDGCVYELQYKEEDGWVRNKMYLQNMSIPGGEVPVVSGLVYMARDWTSNFLGFGGIADLQVDTTRNYLYSLDSKGYVHLWWLGPDGEANLKQYQCKAHVGSKDAKPVSIHVIPRQKNTDHEILSVLLQDGTRILFSATNNHDGRQRQLQPPRSSYMSDLGSCPVKTFSLLSLQPVDVGPLHPTLPVEQLGHLGPVDDAPGRSYVGAKVSLLIPKNHQTQPQLVCTASLGLESQGNVLSIVDLQPLVRQADTWRKGEIPTTGINIFCVEEEEWAGSSIQTSSSDLITQVVRPPPRFLVAHSAGVTFLTRLRPVDLLHISLFHPQSRDLARQLPGLTQDQIKQLDFDWLVATYGKVEVSVMLLTLICSDARPTASQTPQQTGTMAGPVEESIANMLATRPTHNVVQRAQEQLNKMGYAGHAGLFQYFVRAVSSLWTTSFVSPFWEHLWDRKQFSLFVAPLEGLQQFLSQLVSPSGDYQHMWNPSTDMLRQGTSVVACMLENESFSDIYYELLSQNSTLKPDPDTLKLVEALSRRGLLAVVERTVQALKILRALEDLTVEHRQNIVAKIRGMELGRVVSYSSDESEAFTDALMGELLQLPYGPVDKVWSVWRQCKYFFDPAAVDFYEARKLILSPVSAGNANVIQEALKRLERPEVAHCLLRRQSNQEAGSVRLEIICEDLRRGKHYLGAMHLAMVAAKHCDPENRAEDWHMATAEPDTLHGVDTSARADLDQAFNYFNARRIAYNEIMYTLELLCSNESMEVDGKGSLNSIRAQRASAIEWALGPAASKYFDGSQRNLARPILAGELFKSTDRLLHFHLYTWLICRTDGDGVWPSRCDVQRIRPYRSPQQAVGDSLTQFLSAGHYALIIKHPLTSWTHQLTHAWTGIWDTWHIGLLKYVLINKHQTTTATLLTTASP